MNIGGVLSACKTFDFVTKFLQHDCTRVILALTAQRTQAVFMRQGLCAALAEHIKDSNIDLFLNSTDFNTRHKREEEFAATVIYGTQ